MFVVVVFLFMFFAGCEGQEEEDDDAPSSNPDDDDDSDDDDNNDDNNDSDDDDDDLPLPPSLIPGPDDAGYDSELEALARQYDRQFYTFNAFGMGLSADIVVDLEDTEGRQQIETFLRETDEWDFEQWSGVHPFDIVIEWQKATGLYSGAGIAADAFRYGVLRDTGYDDVEIDRAREHLLRALDGLHIASAITGVEGVIARSIVAMDIPSEGQRFETTPLFDEYGNPLPPQKNNGEWREDNSGGLYPDYIWEDSCSRDMYIGWAAAFGAAWEVIREDPDIPQDAKDRLQQDAKKIGHQLMVVRQWGFDLEVPDADGRTTYHGYFNENSFDRMYLPFLPFKNGMISIMALGSVAALAYVAEDQQLEDYLYHSLIGQRALHLIARNNQLGVDFWLQTNYSNVNMAFMGAWLALRYIYGENIRSELTMALELKLYDKPGWTRQPADLGQSLFDFVFASGMAGANAWEYMNSDPDTESMAKGIQTLKEFPVPPFWEIAIENCDESEIESNLCIGIDGTEIELLGYIGRGDKLVSKDPVPMRIRPTSNYHWRTNPYEVNGGGSQGTRMVPGVDFRFAYWLGRWVR